MTDASSSDISIISWSSSIESSAKSSLLLIPLFANLAILSSSYCQEKIGDNNSRIVLKIPDFLAPYKLAVLPLVKKDGLSDYANKIYDDLKLHYNIIYDDKDAIGRRYRRQDAIGTPICLTVDHDSKKDNSVTLRLRDSMQQIRLDISEIKNEIDKRISLSNLLKKS